MRKALLVFYLLLPFVFWLSVALSGQSRAVQTTGLVQFGGFYKGTPVWHVGDTLSVVTASVPTHKQFAELEGQRVVLTVMVWK